MNLPLFFKVGNSGADRREQEIIRAAQQGSRSSFDALCRNYTPLLRGFLLRRVGPNAAEDVLQDTLVAAWTGLPKYQRQARFKSWLYAIAAHKCTDWYRKSGRTAEVPLDEAAGMPDSWMESAANLERNQILRAAMTKIPDTHRETLELYYDAGLTLAEIAQALGLKLNTVKYQFYRAHTLLEKELRWKEPQEFGGETLPREHNNTERKGPAVL